MNAFQSGESSQFQQSGSAEAAINDGLESARLPSLKTISQKGTFCPEPEVTYPISVEWKERTYSFSVVFDSGLCEFFREKNVLVDFEKGEIIGSKGRGRLCPAGTNVDVEELPPWIIYEDSVGLHGFPSGTLRLLLQNGKLSLGFTAALQTDLPVLEPGTDYPVTTEWNGKTYDFKLQVTPAYIQYMQNRYLWIDFEKGELVQGSNGLRTPVVPGAAEEYVKVTGREAPPWITEFKEYGLFGIPKGKMLVDREGDFTVADFDYLASDSFFRCEPGINVTQNFDQIPAEEWHPIHFSYAPNISIEAENQQLLERAKELVEKVLGTANKDYLKRETELRSEKQNLSRLYSDLSAEHDPEVHEKLLEEARTLLKTGPGTEKWDALRLINERLQQLAYRVDHELKVVVVPAGKHWSAMPHFNSYDTSSLDISGVAANYCLPDHTYVFILEDDMQTNCPWLSMHELHHPLIRNLVEPQIYERQIEIHKEARRNDGPFAREYGVQEKEFWTTFAELFEGRYGSEGAEWFAEKQPELFKLMCDATGRNPLH